MSPYGGEGHNNVAAVVVVAVATAAAADTAQRLLCQRLLSTVMLYETLWKSNQPINVTYNDNGAHGMVCTCLQCFDAVAWAAGRASGL